MQDQNQPTTAHPDAANTVVLPGRMAEHLRKSDIVLFVSTVNGAAVVTPVTPLGAYDPENNPAHLLAAAIISELPNLQAAANGDWTDSDRYQALRAFALLAVEDNERFEAINRGIQEYETKNGVNLAATGDPEAYNAYANFIADAVLVTHPDDVAEQPKELVIPGSRIILPLR